MTSMYHKHMKEDFIILIHKYGYERLGKFVTRDDVWEYLKANGVDISPPEIRTAIDEVLTDSYISGYSEGRSIYVFKSDAYYRYLEYLELVESRRSSAVATWIAVTALIVSIIIGMVQIAQK